MKSFHIFFFSFLIFISIEGYSQNSYTHMFYEYPRDLSTKDSLKLISQGKIFYDFFSKAHRRSIVPNIYDSVEVTTLVCVSKKNGKGYFSTFINPDTLIEIVELEKNNAHGYHYEYDLLRPGSLNFKIHYRNGKMDGDYFQYGIRNKKKQVVVHYIYKKGKRVKTLLDL